MAELLTFRRTFVIDIMLYSILYFLVKFIHNLLIFSINKHLYQTEKLDFTIYDNIRNVVILLLNNYESSFDAFHKPGTISDNRSKPGKILLLGKAGT